MFQLKCIEITQFVEEMETFFSVDSLELIIYNYSIASRHEKNKQTILFLFASDKMSIGTLLSHHVELSMYAPVAV